MYARKEEQKNYHSKSSPFYSASYYISLSAKKNSYLRRSELCVFCGPWQWDLWLSHLKPMLTAKRLVFPHSVTLVLTPAWWTEWASLPWRQVQSQYLLTSGRAPVPYSLILTKLVTNAPFLRCFNTNNASAANKYLANQWLAWGDSSQKSNSEFTIFHNAFISQYGEIIKAYLAMDVERNCSYIWTILSVYHLSVVLSVFVCFSLSDCLSAFLSACPLFIQICVSVCLSFGLFCCLPV